MNCLVLGICRIISSLWVLNAATATFFHEHSYTEIQPSEKTPTTDFGFTLGYWADHKSLVIGAPHHDFNGQVFARTMQDIFKEKIAKANNIDINIEKLAGDYDRSKSPEQNFCLGASISVYKKNILTCAPLWTSQLSHNTTITYGPLGTCFLVTDTHTVRYNGLFEQNSSGSGKLFGGSGWSTLADEKNNLLLISISPYSPHADISYMEGSSITNPVKFMNLFENMNYKTQQLYKNMGTFVMGHFFDKEVTYYAYSARNDKTFGIVGFIRQPKIRKPWYVQGPRGIWILSSSKVGTMFGVALCSADVNIDGFSDLLVGEPALGEEYFESGAVNIFLGGDMKKMKRPKLIIYGNTPGGRFGTTIASTDLDRDRIPEIFVSAPFEDSGDGAVYIISGYEIKKLLDQGSSVIHVPLSDLTLTQRIQNKEYKWFGYSLQVLPDLDANGYDDVAIGAPKSAKVVVYRSIPSITVQVTAKLKNRSVVYVSDMTFDIRLELKIIHPSKSTIESANLMTTVKVRGNGISFDPTGRKDTYIIPKKVSNENKTYSDDLTLHFARKQSGIYTFYITVQGDIEKYLKAEDFNNSMVRISPQSKLTYTLPIHRQCQKDKNCDPRLSASFIWPEGNNTHILGSTANQTMTVVVTNEGSESYESCAKIWVEGSQVNLIGCSKIDMDQKIGYICPLTKLITDKTQEIDILLDMSKQYSSDLMFRVKVFLYNICSQDNFTSYERIVPFIQDTERLVIDGMSHERNVTDGEVESETKTIIDEHEFILINKGIVTWRSINAMIKIPKEYIESYRMVLPEGVDCKENDTTTANFFCNIDLERKSTLKIKISFTVAKNNLMKNLQDEMLKASSTLFMQLPTNEKVVTKEHKVTTTFLYVKDKSWDQNKYLIIALAILGSIIIIGVIAGILYKIGFFERKEKEMLTKLRRDMSQRKSQVPERAVEAIEEENEEIHDTAVML